MHWWFFISSVVTEISKFIGIVCTNNSNNHMYISYTKSYIPVSSIVHRLLAVSLFVHKHTCYNIYNYRNQHNKNIITIQSKRSVLYIEDRPDCFTRQECITLNLLKNTLHVFSIILISPGFHRGSCCPVICVSLFHVILLSFESWLFLLFVCLVSVCFLLMLREVDELFLNHGTKMLS